MCKNLSLDKNPQYPVKKGTLLTDHCHYNGLAIESLLKHCESLITPPMKKRFALFKNQLTYDITQLQQSSLGLFNEISSFVPKTKRFAMFATVRVSHNGFLGQLLASNAGSRQLFQVMLHHLQGVEGHHFHLYFAPHIKINHYLFGPKRVQTLQKKFGPESCDARLFSYLLLPPSSFGSHPPLPPATNYDVCYAEEFENFVGNHWHPTIVQTDELTAQDISLTQLNRAYETVGLQRHRTIFLALTPTAQALIGTAIVYRGAFFNFGLMCNRCDLVIDPHLSANEAQLTITRLLQSVARYYQDFPPQVFPIITDPQTAQRIRQWDSQASEIQYIRSSFNGKVQLIFSYYRNLFQSQMPR